MLILGSIVLSVISGVIAVFKVIIKILVIVCQLIVKILAILAWALLLPFKGIYRLITGRSAEIGTDINNIWSSGWGFK